MSNFVDKLEQLGDEASPGPWEWRGNVDFGDVYLGSWGGKCGLETVFGPLNVDRTESDPRLRDLSDSFDDEQIQDIRDDFLEDENGNPRTDSRMAFAVDGRMKPASDLAVFEVCREATTRSDPRVYRADIVDVRHPDAAFIATARNLWSEMVAVVGLADELVCHDDNYADIWKQLEIALGNLWIKVEKVEI